MRSIALRRPSEEEEESVFVTMTDMAISFLIILMILLAFFASRFSDDDMVPVSELEIEQQLTASLQETIALLSLHAPITPADLAALQRQLEQAKQSLVAAKGAFERESERLNSKLSVANRQFAMALSELEKEKQLTASLQETVALLSLHAPITPADLAALQRQLEQARQSLVAAKDAFERESERLNSKLSDARKELTLAQLKLANLESELTIRDDTLRSDQLTIAALNDTIRQLQKELANLRPLPEEVERLKRKIATLELELENLRHPNPLEDYLLQVAESRLIAIRKLRDAIRQEFPNLQVVMSAEADALRFQGEGLFESNAHALSDEKRRIVERISEILDEILPCYSLGERSDHDASCNPGYAVIEAVQIEGHTDSDGSESYNIGLASDRAVSTFRAMSEHVSGLRQHKNLDGRPVLSVAGYGEDRPVANNATIEGRSTNRRIDLRFIMHEPNRSEEIDIIRRKLTQGVITSAQP